MKHLFTLACFLSTGAAFADAYTCTITVDGELAKSAAAQAESNNKASVASSSGFFVCTGTLQNGLNTATLSIPSFGLNSVAIASVRGETNAVALYTEQSERSDDADFHVRCECGLL